MRTSAVSPFNPSLSSSLKIEEKSLSKTDWKTHALVVLSYTLLTLGVVLALGSFYFATMFHPMIAASFPVPFILGGTIGIHQFGREGPPLEKTQDCPPLGLNNKNGVNCWLNAAIQLLFNCPAYVSALQKLQREYQKGNKTSLPFYSSLKDFLQAFQTYTKEQMEGKKSTSTLNTQKTREALYDKTVISLEDAEANPITKRDAETQEDTAEVIRYVLGNLHSSKEKPDVLVRKVTRKEWGNSHTSLHRYGENEEAQPLISLNLSSYRNQRAVSISTLLKSQFFSYKTPTPSGRGSNTVEQYFETPPDDLTVNIERFYKQTEGIRIGTNIQDALQVNCSKQEVGEKSSYLLDGFIVHEGDSLQSGHYFSVVRVKNQWMRISDNSPVEILTLEQVQKYAQQAVILHYQRAEKFTPLYSPYGPTRILQAACKVPGQLYQQTFGRLVGGS